MRPVQVDERPCAVCELPIDGGPRAVALRAGGELRWCHQVCAVNASGGHSAMRPNGTQPTAIAAWRDDSDYTIVPRIVHLADLHIGFRAYYRLTPAGQNQREADIADTFRRVISQVIDLQPDVVLIAGDVFHKVEPSNFAMAAIVEGLLRLRSALPNCVLVAVAGNHDTPRTGDTGHSFTTLAALGVRCAVADGKRIDLPQFDLSILAVPDAGGPRTLLEPDPDRGNNVLLLHGEVEYIEPNTASAFDYVALGHYHTHRLLTPAPNAMAYAGSIDYTSTNPWGELAEERAAGLMGKGFLVIDNFTAGPRFVPIAPSRTFIDLPEIDGNGKTSEDLDAALVAVLEAHTMIDGAIVRAVARDVDKTVAASINHAALRSLKARALDFQLRLHRPAPVITVGTDGRPRRGKSLEDIVRDGMAKRQLLDGVDRTAATELALKYLDQAREQEDTPTEEPVTP